MIIKSSQRRGAKQLADHLTNSYDNELVEFSHSRGILAQTVHEALDDMEDMAKASSKCQQHLHHVSINPDAPITSQEWEQIWQLYEEEFGLEDNAFIEVTHCKNDRLHKHRVYERVGENGKAVPFSHSYRRNEKLSRHLEYELGHELTLGKHNRSVINQLELEGEKAIAQWMKEAQADSKTRPQGMVTNAERQQEVRTKIPVKQVQEELLIAYEQTDNGRAFQVAIAEKGYLLAKGDQRGFVIVDEAGGVHSPSRRLGVKTADINNKWADIPLEHLPTVTQVQERIGRQKQRQHYSGEKTLEAFLSRSSVKVAIQRAREFQKHCSTSGETQAEQALMAWEDIAQMYSEFLDSNDLSPTPMLSQLELSQRLDDNLSQTDKNSI